MFIFKRKFSNSWVKLVNCNSCGIKLQNQNPNAVGFYIEPKKLVTNKINSLQDLKYLLFSQDVQSFKEQENVGSLKELKETMESPLICKRCSDALYKNEYNLREFARYSSVDILEKIPKDSNVLHVVPLSEFPFHFEKSLFENPHFSTSLVMTKGDQLAKNKGTLQRKAFIFFRDFLKFQLNIVTNKVVAVSGLKQWNLQSAYAIMSEDSYLVGDTNVGKSMLINSLMQKYLGYKIHINRKGQVLASQPNAKKLRNIKHFLNTQFAGVSHIPNMTRNLQGYRIGDKFIYDLPGITTNFNELHYEDILRMDWLERTRKTEKFNTRKLRKQIYTSVKGTEKGNCYTVGGIFFWKPPPGTINQVVNYISGGSHQFTNINKGLQVFHDCRDDSHPLAKFCGVRPEICRMENYLRHVIPPFQGTIEVILKNIGYVFIRTTGRYQFKGLHELWVPKGIDVLVREPLEPLINDGVRRHVESRGAIPACPKDRPLVSSTYILDSQESDVLQTVKKMYLERTSNDISSRRFTHEDPIQVLSKFHEERINLYWHYMW